MKRVKFFTREILIALTVMVLWQRPVYATHASGGENDLMGLYGGIALLLGFAGLLGMLGLVPRGWRSFGARWGRWFLGGGILVLIGGGYHVTTIGTVEETLGDIAFGRLATQQLIGTLVVFVSFWGAIYYLAKRSGILNMGESVKYQVMRNGDPPERSASRPDRPGEQRLMWVPFAAMGGLALFVTAGVLIALYRLPPGARP